MTVPTVVAQAVQVATQVVIRQEQAPGLATAATVPVQATVVTATAPAVMVTVTAMAEATVVAMAARAFNTRAVKLKAMDNCRA